MSDEKFGCICICLFFLAVVGVLAALEVYKINHSCRCVKRCSCQVAEACPCQMK